MKQILTNTRPFFEYDEGGSVTVVAINAPLDEFKAQPVTEDGRPMVHFKERTTMDCSLLDGCIYLHLGRVPDSVMSQGAELFQKLKAEMKRNKRPWPRKGHVEVPQSTIIL